MIPKNPALAGLTLIFSLLEGLLLVLPVVRNLTPRLPARVLIPLSAVFFGVCLFAAPSSPYVLLMVLIPGVFIFVFFLFRDHFPKKALWGLLPFILMAISLGCHFFLYPSLFAYSFQERNGSFFFLASWELAVLRNAGMAAAILLYIKRPVINSRTVELLFLLICLLLVIPWIPWLTGDVPDKTHFIGSLLSCGFFFLLWLLIRRLRFTLETRALAEVRELLSEKSRERQEDLVSTYQSMRQLSHDARKTMDTVQVLIRQNKEQDASDLLKDFSDRFPAVFSTGCPEADAYLTLISARCRDNNIRFIRELCPLHDLPLSSYEFGSLLANLLDNALEALLSEDLPDKYIELNLMRSRNMLYLSCKNPTARKADILRDGLISSTKKGPNHGLGLSIIRETVEKADGFMNIRIEGGVFCVDIDMPCP